MLIASLADERSKESNSQAQNSTTHAVVGGLEKARQVVDNVLLGVLVVLFIGAWRLRSRNTSRGMVCITLLVELLLDVAIVVFYLVYLCLLEGLHFWQRLWHLLWMIHLTLLIYKLLCVFDICCFKLYKQERRLDVYADIIGAEKCLLCNHYTLIGTVLTFHS